MNCCDDNGKCTCSNGRETPKTPLRLAPGVIDFGHPTWAEYKAQQRRRELVRWLHGGVKFVVVSVLAALAVGLIVGKLP